jgi:hypothetical protein
MKSTRCHWVMLLVRSNFDANSGTSFLQVRATVFTVITTLLSKARSRLSGFRYTSGVATFEPSLCSLPDLVMKLSSKYVLTRRADRAPCFHLRQRFINSFSGKKVMDNVWSNCRSDEQLEAILYETDYWVVNGQQGQVLGFAASLRQTIDRSTAYAGSDAVVAAICRLPSDNIIVSPAQIERLRKSIAGRELLPIR